ncbi:MAG: dTDP-4-dehydrorhamnose 3,5-epimerase [Magnetococcales bacterium]|nr:dTDP-4-dehydrorhamnose 3,5-epimerase [Magnetococcales bacterium]
MGSRFVVQTTPLAGLLVLQRQPAGDSRGLFERLYCQEELAEHLAGRSIVQINHSWSASRGTVRGLHFQHPPYAETKCVQCLHGEVFDVAVDLRRDSPTYLHWHAELLSATNHKTLLIPEGFAHGFQTLSDGCRMLYFHTQYYCPEAEGGMHVLDPRLAIRWPLPVTGLSARDAGFAMLTATA